MKEFKRGINGTIKKKLIEVEKPPMNIKQWYECATNLDDYWKENQREKERLREKKEWELRVKTTDGDNEHSERSQAMNISSSSIVKRAGYTMSASKVYSNGRGGKNKYSSG